MEILKGNLFRLYVNANMNYEFYIRTILAVNITVNFTHRQHIKRST